MAEEQKLIITLEINAKGEAVLKNLKKEIDDLQKETEKGTRTNRRARDEEKSLTDERDKGAKVVRTRKREEKENADAVDASGKATTRTKTTEKERTVEVETGRKVVERRKRAEKELTHEINVGTDAQKQARDELGRFVGGAGAQRRAIVELANSQGQLTSAIALGVVKAQLFIGLLEGGFRLGLGLVTGPVKALASGIQDVVTNVVTATEKFDRFRITLEGALKSGDRARQVAGFVQEYALRSPVKVEDVQDLTKSIALIPGLRSQFFGDFDEVKVRLNDLYDTVIGLASLNPQQGIPGAVFSIREALTGQFRSLRARFDIMPEIVAGAIGKTVGEIKKSPKLVIAALKEFVNQSVGGDTLRELGRLPSVRIANILEGLTSIAPRQVGTAGFQSFISDIIGNLDDSLQKFFSAGGAFETQFAPRISDRLKGIVIQGLRLIGTVLGGADEALGGAGAPSLERVAQTFESILGRVEQAIKGFADRFAANRSSIAEFFASIIDTIKKAFETFVDVVNALPQLLPVIAGFLSVLVSLTSKVISLFTSIPKFLGSIGKNALVSVLAPDVAEGFRTSGNISAVGGLIRGQAGDRPLTGEFAAASAALVDLASEGKRTFRDLDEGFKDPRRSAFRQFFRGEIEAGGERRDLIQQVLTQLGAGGEGEDRGSRLAARIREEGVSAQGLLDVEKKLTTSGATLSDVEQGLAKTLAERKKLEEDRKRALGGVVTTLDAATFERVTTTPLSPELGNIGLASREERTPVGGEAARRLLAQIGGRVPGEFGGSIAGIKDLGLQVQERLNKLLLDPLEEADSEFIAAQTVHAQAVENLRIAVKGATDEAAGRIKTAIEATDRDIAGGILTAEQGDTLKRRIAETAEKVTKAIGDVAAANTKDASRFNALASAAGFQSAIGVLTKTDVNNVRELDRAFDGVNKRLAILQPLLTETATAAFSDLQTTAKAALDKLKDITGEGKAFLGFDPAVVQQTIAGAKSDFEGLQVVLAEVNRITSAPGGLFAQETVDRLKQLAERATAFTGSLGTEGAKNLASFAFASRSSAFGQAQGIRSAFGGGTPETELKALRDQLQAVSTRSEVEARIEEILKSSAVTERERTVFAERLRELADKEREQLEVTIAAKKQAFAISKSEEVLQRALAEETDPGKRYAIISTALQTVQDEIDRLQGLLASPDGQVVANLLGIGDPAKAKAAAEGALTALEARRKQLQDVARDADPARQFRAVTRGVRPGETVSAQALFNVLPEAQKKKFEAEYGELGTRIGIAFLDKFQLVTADELGPRLKTFQEIFIEAFTELSLKAVDLLQSSIGDTIYDVFTGNLDDISKVWDNFLKGLLRAFSDFLAELIVKKALTNLFESFLGGLGGAAGSASGAASGGFGGGESHAASFATGGIVGPGSGGPILAMIGEGSQKEGIIPLTPAGAVPARLTPQGGMQALLPGGGTIPIAISGYAQGGITSGSVQPVSMPVPDLAPIYIINTMDPVEVVSAGLPGNARVVENQVAGSMRNRGPVGKAVKRYGGR